MNPFSTLPLLLSLCRSPQLFARIVLQTLSLRLGLTTSLSLPRQIRLLFLRMHDHPRVSPYKWRRRAVMAGLYGLYGLAEMAIIATDLAELLGSAIALNLWVLWAYLFSTVGGREGLVC